MASEQTKKSSRPPAKTIEEREDQLIDAAYDLAEKQILKGTASSQTIAHFLKLGTVREGLEREKLRRENMLLEARTDQIESGKNMEELYQDAIAAMSRYKGIEDRES